MTEIVALAPAAGWQVVAEDDGVARPLVAWALVSDRASVPFVVGLVVADDGDHVELAPTGNYLQGVAS